MARRGRAADDTTPLAQGLDPSHTAREARGVLHRARQGAEAAWAKAEASDARVAASKRIAMAWRWWGRHQGSNGTADPRLELIRAAAWGRPLSEAEGRSYARVSAGLSGTVPASGAVEWMNSALREQHSNHKRMTQEMLDLKRLYWNSHRLKAGKPKDSCPYEHLGLGLPSFDFWELPQTDPEQLTQELSGRKDAG